MNNKTIIDLINTNDDEFDFAIAEAIEKYTQCNIRFRSPNRKIGTAQQKTALKSEREMC